MSKPITHKRLVSALTKAGMIVTKDERSTSNPHYIATNPKNGTKIDWYTQDGFIPSTPTTEAYWDKNKPIVTHVAWRHPDTDSQSDLFMDSYRDTIKGALHLLEVNH